MKCTVQFRALKMSTSRIIFISPTLRWVAWASASIFHHVMLLSRKRRDGRDMPQLAVIQMSPTPL